MKIKIFLLSGLLFISVLIYGQEGFLVTWDYNNQSFKEFVSTAEKKLNLKFFFRDNWISGITLHSVTACKTVPCILDFLFKGTSLRYYIYKDRYVIITENFSIVPVNDSSGVINNAQDAPQLADLSRIDSGDTTLYTIGNISDRYTSGNVLITGQIVNKTTKEPVAGATVFVQRLLLGTVSNNKGFYSLSIPRGVYLLSFSFIGMQSQTVKAGLYGNGILNFEMSNLLIPLQEVVVSDQKSILERSETGLERISVATLKLVPTPFGETDIIKNLMLMPGVKTIGEGSAGFNVRGGSADQNLILLYGAPVFNSSHLFGFFSAINSDVIRNISLYKGGIPGKYGGRISSVLDIETREGDKKSFRGNAGISPVTTHLVVEGPVIRDTLSFLIAARTTYSNWIFGLIKDPVIRNSKASFSDFNGVLTYNPGKNDKIELSSYISSDNFNFLSSTRYNYRNQILALGWWHSFSQSLYSNISVTGSEYRYDMTNSDIISEGYVLSHKIGNYGIKSDFHLIRARHDINFGMDLHSYSVIPGYVRPANDSSNIVTEMIQKEKALEGALYLDDRYTLTEFLTLYVGLRTSAFASLGPKKVFIYNPDFARSSSAIIDTVNYGAGRIIGRFAGPELRLSLNFRISDLSSFKVNYNRTRQYLHLLTNTTTISPTDTWKLCDSYLKPEIGDQYAAGFYQLLGRKRYELSAEAYYKEINNMADYKGGTSLVMIENLEQHMVNVEGKARGYEFSFKKTQGKLLYTIAYTWSRTLLRSRSAFREETINSGSWYPANYDKPHDLNIALNYFYSRRLSFSGNLTYSSGRPVTYPLSVYKMRNIFLVDYSDRNIYRLPYTLRVDIGCKISGNLRAHKKANPNLTLSVYNLFGRENPYNIYFKKEQEVLKGYMLSLLGRPIPSVTFSFDF